MKVIFHRLAKREFAEAAGFYEDRVEGLGTVFLDYLWQSLQLLRKHPRSAPILRRFADVTVRKRVLTKFPYNLIFCVEEQAIYILATAHQKRRPDYWVRRVRDIEERMTQLAPSPHKSVDRRSLPALAPAAGQNRARHRS